MVVARPGHGNNKAYPCKLYFPTDLIHIAVVRSMHDLPVAMIMN